MEPSTSPAAEVAWKLPLVDAVDAEADELLDGEVFHATGAEARNVFRRDAVDTHGHELLRVRMLVAEALELLDELGRNAVNAEGDELVQVDVIVAVLGELRHPLGRSAVNAHGHESFVVGLIAGLVKIADHFRAHAVDAERNELLVVGDVHAGSAKLLDEFRRDAMNAKGDEFFAVGDSEARGAELLDELRRDAVDAEGDELLGVERFEVLALDLLGEGVGDVHDGHAELSVAVDAAETERSHFLRVFGVGEKVEDAGAFAVVKKAFALEAAGVARDSELDVLLAGLGDVQALEGAERPVGFVVGRAVLIARHEGEFDFAGLVRAANGPVTALRVRGMNGQRAHHPTDKKYVANYGVSAIHGKHLLVRGLFEDSGVFQRD